VTRTALLAFALAAAGCGPAVTVRRLAPAPYNLGPARKLALIESHGGSRRDSEAVRARLLERVDQQGVFEIDDASPRMPDLFDLLERIFTREAPEPAPSFGELRKRYPADVYVRLRVSELRSWRRDKSEKKKDKEGKETVKVRYWAEADCGFQLTLVDGRDGRRIARFSVLRHASSPIYDSWHDGLLSTAEREAVYGAVDEALAQFTPRQVTDRLQLDDKAPRAAEGIKLIEEGKLREARLLWEQAVKDAPGSGGLHYNLGCVSEALGDTRAAAEWYEDAIRLDGSSERNRRAAADLKRRMDDAERLRMRD